MACMQQGLMGPFTGKIGGVIGYFINGIQYVRKAPKKRKVPSSEKQIIQQEKFSMMTKFLSGVRPFIYDVHKKVYRRENRYYKLFSLNYSEALKGDYPDFTIDYGKVKLTTGSLVTSRGIHVSCNPDAVLDFHWDDLSKDYWIAHPWDRLYLAIYNEDNKNWEIVKNAALREDEFTSVDMSQHRGSSLHVYTGFISEDKCRISNSRYMGMIKIQ